MKTLRFILIIVTAFLVCGGLYLTPLRAGELAPVQTEKPKLVGDKNGDGKLSREEFTNAIADAAMKQMDANGDGYISKEEAMAANQADAKDKSKEPKDKITPVFDKVDQNNDGKISRDELRKALEKDKQVETFFEGRDRDRDGFIQPYETTLGRTTAGIRFKF